MLHFAQDMTSQGFNLTNSLDFITEKLNTKGVLITRGWENFDHIATHAEFTTLEVNVIALKLDIN